jgi:hypothetical protein
MAGGITFETQPQSLRPVYGNIPFVVYDSSNASTAGHYYEFLVTTDKGNRLLRQLPDENGRLDLDLQGILQGYFRSEVITHPSFIIEVSSGLLQYSVVAYGYGTVDVSAEAGPFYVFNGVDRDDYVPENYLFGQGSNPWLTRWAGPREIEENDTVFLQGLHGEFNGYTSEFDGYYYRWTRNNGQEGKLGIYIDASTMQSVVGDEGIFSVNLSTAIQSTVFSGAFFPWRRGPKNFNATKPYPNWTTSYTVGSFELIPFGAADSSLVIYDASTGAGYYAVSFDGDASSYLITQPIGFVDTSTISFFRPLKSNSLTLGYTAINYETGAAISSTIFSDASGGTSFNIPLTASYTGPVSIKIDCSTAQSFNLFIGAVVSSNINPAFNDINSLTFYSWDGSWTPITFDFQPRDCRFDRKYRIAYVNSLGGTDFFNFTLANLNNIRITKTIFRNTSGLNVYGTEVQDRYSLTSDWVSEITSLDLKDLWYSPRAAVMNEASTGYKGIVYDVGNQDILRKRNQRLINYELNFTYSSDYTAQRN